MRQISKIKDQKLKRQAGFTLLELLIAVTIFSGMIILAFGAFARSASTAAQSNSVRERTEAARSVVDQISTDFRYLAETESPAGCPSVPNDPPNGVWKGFCLDAAAQGLNSVHLLLQYPNESSYVGKTYFVTNSDNNFALKVAEKRGCFTVNDCPPLIENAKTILSSNYLLDNQDVFSGQAQTPIQGGFLRLKLAIKPAAVTSRCDDLELGACYELSTTLVPGGY